MWHLWNDSTLKEPKLNSHTHTHTTAGPTPQESKCDSELWKQWTEFKTLHVFLWSVSGNGSRSKIKKGCVCGEGGGGGANASQKKENDETMPPPHTHSPLGRLQCMARGAVFGGGHGWGAVWIPSLQADYLNRKKERAEG